MFIFFLLAIALATLTEKAPEIQVDEMLLANDNVTEEILNVNELVK